MGKIENTKGKNGEKDKRIAELETKLKELQLTVAEKNATIKQLELLSTKEPLTELFNRRGLEEHLKPVLSRITPPGTPEAKKRRQGALECVSFLLLDVDHFKLVNDKYGHTVGDEVLRRVAKHLRTKVVLDAHPLRLDDIVCRWGGEEFLVVFPGTSKEDVAERLKDPDGIPRIEVSGVAVGQENITVTLSGGLVEYRYGEDYEKNTVDRADLWLRNAKDWGRNQIVVEPD